MIPINKSAQGRDFGSSSAALGHLRRLDRFRVRNPAFGLSSLTSLGPNLRLHRHQFLQQLFCFQALPQGKVALRLMLQEARFIRPFLHQLFENRERFLIPSRIQKRTR
jgi:hypothetical protein